MNEKQKSAFDTFTRENPFLAIVESPENAWNITFGSTTYFTTKYGEYYNEYGIMPNGKIFKVC